MAWLRRVVEGRRVPGDHSHDRLDEALRRGTVTIPDDLWTWLAAAGA